MSHVADIVAGGIDPAQHPGYKAEGFTVDNRIVRYKGRLKLAKDSDGIVRPSFDDGGTDTLGDDLGQNFWGKNTRPLPAWSPAWAVIGLKTAKPQGAGVGVPHGGVPVQLPKTSVLPSQNRKWEADQRFAPKKPAPPPNIPLPAPGSTGLVVSATEEGEQHDLYLPADNSLISDHVTPVRYSSIVRDVDRDGQQSEIRHGGLQYLTQVVRPFTAPGWQPALNLRGSSGTSTAQGAAREGQGMFVEAGDHLGHLAHIGDQGGPIMADPSCDKHLYGRHTEDGATFTEHAGHIATDAFFKKRGDREKDAPIDFKEPYFEPGGRPPIPYEAELRYDPRVKHDWNRQKKDGKWRINYWLPMRPSRPPTVPPQVPPPDPPRVPPAVPPAPPIPPRKPPNPPENGKPPKPKPPGRPITGDPSMPGAPRPVTGGGSTPTARGPITQDKQEERQRKIREASEQGKAAAAVPSELEAESFHIVPLPIIPAADGARLQNAYGYTLNPYSPPAAYDSRAWQTYNSLPRVVHMQAFAQQRADGSFVYSDRLVSDEHMRQAAKGGFMFLPAELDLYDQRTPAYENSAFTDGFVGLHPRLALCWGRPHDTLGVVVSGIRMRQTSATRFVVDWLNSSGSSTLGTLDIEGNAEATRFLGGNGSAASPTFGFVDPLYSNFGIYAAANGDGNSALGFAVSGTLAATVGPTGLQVDEAVSGYGFDTYPLGGLWYDADTYRDVVIKNRAGTILMAGDSGGDEVIFPTAKATFLGLIYDPTGVELTPVGANPGSTAANTLWLDSGNGNVLKHGANRVMLGSNNLSEVANAATARSNIGAGTGNVNLTGIFITGNLVKSTSGGDIEDAGFAPSAVYRSGGTDVPITDGGTGASDADGAINNIVSAATNRTPVLADRFPFEVASHASQAGAATFQQALNLIASLTAETTLDPANDKIALYDSSGAATDSMTPQAFMNGMQNLAQATSATRNFKLLALDASNVAKYVDLDDLDPTGQILICRTVSYTGSGSSGKTVTLTGINRAHVLSIFKSDNSGTNDQNWSYPVGGTGSQTVRNTAGSSSNWVSLDAPAAGTNQVLTINSTGANENASGVNYRIVVWGTPT